MSLVTRLRHRQRSIGRTVLGLFGVVWLQMAMQPCLMALDLDAADQQHDCPHCLPVADKGHCADEAPEACTYIDGFDYDGRTPVTTELGFDQYAFVGLPATELAPPTTIESSAQQPRRLAARAPSRDLTLEYCVLLT